MPVRLWRRPIGRHTGTRVVDNGCRWRAFSPSRRGDDFIRGCVRVRGLIRWGFGGGGLVFRIAVVASSFRLATARRVVELTDGAEVLTGSLRDPARAVDLDRVAPVLPRLYDGPASAPSQGGVSVAILDKDSLTGS